MDFFASGQRSCFIKGPETRHRSSPAPCVTRQVCALVAVPRVLVFVFLLKCPPSLAAAQNKSLEAEIADVEAGADEDYQEVLERAEKAEEENKTLQKRLDGLEVSTA